MSCRACFHGKARHHGKRNVECVCCFDNQFDNGAKNVTRRTNDADSGISSNANSSQVKTEDSKLADSDKVIVEIVKTEAPVKEPTFEWWICWRDKPDDKDFKCVTVDTNEQVFREVERLGQELNGRQIWVAALINAYKSEIVVKTVPIVVEVAKTECVN